MCMENGCANSQLATYNSCGLGFVESSADIADFSAHAAHAPAFAPLRRRRDFGQDAGDLPRQDRRFATPSWGFFKSGEPVHLETFRPCRDPLRRRLHSHRYFSDADAIEPQKNNLGALAFAHHALLCARPPRLPNDCRNSARTTSSRISLSLRRSILPLVLYREVLGVENALSRSKSTCP